MGKTLYEKYITFCMQSFPISLINILLSAFAKIVSERMERKSYLCAM